MKKLSQVQKVVEYLKSSPNQQFTARKIALAITSSYPQDYEKKRHAERFENDNAFIQQIVAEIGAQKNSLQKASAQIRWQDKPRPRVYWYADENEETLDSPAQVITNEKPTLSEHDLYPILMKYLHVEHQLYCLRIDEKRSKNNKGSGGNQWLHPDIVAMEAMTQNLHPHVQTCLLKGDGQSAKLWSFEVKKKLTMGNVRQCFFQAVSNSSWANEGYLVAESIDGNQVMQELKMLSSLHGIGVILLSVEDVSESEILFPANKRTQTDWLSANRLVEENKDFRHFIDLVSNYYQTGRVRTDDWYRLDG